MTEIIREIRINAAIILSGKGVYLRKICFKVNKSIRDNLIRKRINKDMFSTVSRLRTKYNVYSKTDLIKIVSQNKSSKVYKNFYEQLSLQRYYRRDNK